MSIDPVFLTAIAALLGAAAAIIKSFRTPVGESATAAEKYQKIAYKAISECEKMRDDINRLRVQLGELEIRLSEYEHGVEILIHQLRSHQIEPNWEPNKE